MNNLGIVVPHLGASQIAYKAITEINRVKTNKILFFDQLTTPMLPINCATMCINELMSFKGVLITTNLQNTSIAHKLLSRKNVKLIFYVWDTEWLRPGRNDYLSNVSIYHQPDVLIARNHYHAQAIENYCNITPKISEFNLQGILKC